MKCFRFSIFLLLLILIFNVDDYGVNLHRETINPDIPYQRAIIIQKNNTETLFLQSKYIASNTNIKNPKEMTWIIPLPSLPEIATINHQIVCPLFFYDFNISTSPHVTHYGHHVYRFTLYICIITFVVVLILKLEIIPNSKKKIDIILGILIFILIFVAVYSMSMRDLSKNTNASIDNDKYVDIDKPKVVQPHTIDEFLTWLDENNFNYNEEDKATFEHYISKGWCFAATHINPKIQEEAEDKPAAMLTAPLILRFNSETPIYPKILADTSDSNSEVLIYLASDHKMICSDKKMTLKRARECTIKTKFKPYLQIEPSQIEPSDFFTLEDVDLNYLCKFKAILTPNQMKKDIIFTKALDNTPYQEQIVEW